MKFKNYSLVLLILSLGTSGFVSSCGEESPTDDVSFDRKAMLTSIADGLIIPNFETLQSSVVLMRHIS